MRVFRWGKRLAVRLPAAVVDALGLREGDEVEFHDVGAQTFAINKSLSNEERLVHCENSAGACRKVFAWIGCKRMSAADARSGAYDAPVLTTPSDLECESARLR